MGLSEREMTASPQHHVAGQRCILPYAPRGPRKLPLRRLALAALAVAAVSSFLYFWKPISHRVALLKWQRECLRYLPAPDEVAYTNYPDGQELLKADNTYRTYNGTSPDVYGLCPPWAKFAQALAGGPNRQDASGYYYRPMIIFLHRRQSPSGEPRLVAVYAPAGDSIEYVVLKIGTLISQPQRLKRSRGVTTGYSILNRRGEDPLRVYMGEPDPSDASHFTIRYETPSGSGVIDGWLRDDESVALRVRDGPASMPAGYYEDVERKWDSLTPAELGIEP
jgi:hypothetical protein